MFAVFIEFGQDRQKAVRGLVPRAAEAQEIRG